MDLDNAAAFMLGTVGYGLGIIVLVAVVVIINNIIAKYWKPIRIFTADSWNLNPPTRFVTEEEFNRVTPTLNEEAKK